MINNLVSIIIPAYNGTIYLKKAIYSALRQTYNNCEILVVNDGSDDNGQTRSVALSFGDSIRYFEKENGGVASALNLGIDNMRGEYFSWLSHDDLYMPDKIEKQMLYFQHGKYPRDILYSDYYIINQYNIITNIVCFNHTLLTEKPHYALLRGCLNGCTMLIPKNAFAECGIFNEKLRTTQDYDLWMRLSKKYRFVHMKKPLVMNRIHRYQGSRVIPEYESEGDQLWINMMKLITPYEMERLEGSEHDFFAGMASFLYRTPYRKAEAYARSRIGTEREIELNRNNKHKKRREKQNRNTEKYNNINIRYGILVKAMAILWYNIENCIRYIGK